MPLMIGMKQRMVKNMAESQMLSCSHHCSYFPYPRHASARECQLHSHKEKVAQYRDNEITSPERMLHFRRTDHEW